MDVLLMPALDQLTALEKRVLEVIQAEGDEWITREQIAHLLPRPGQIHPNDIKALNRLVDLGLIEARQSPRGVAGVKWEYRVRQDE